MSKHVAVLMGGWSAEREVSLGAAYADVIRQEAARMEIRKSWRETCELNKKHPQAAELFNPDKLPAEPPADLHPSRKGVVVMLPVASLGTMTLTEPVQLPELAATLGIDRPAPRAQPARAARHRGRPVTARVVSEAWTWNSSPEPGSGCCSRCVCIRAGPLLQDLGASTGFVGC